MLVAPSTNGSYPISGTFKDELTNTGTVSGVANIKVGGTNYDTNGNGRIEKNEAVNAVVDYFNGAITKQDAVSIMMAYFIGR